VQGKIFSESMNLCQDQARILFNYYRKAAEKIVKQEIDLEKSISLAKSEIELAEKNRIKGIIITAAFPAAGIALALILIFAFMAAVAIAIILGAFLVLGAIWGVITLMKALKSKKENETKITGFEEAYRDIRRDFKVRKMGVVYVPVATKVPFEGKSFIMDHTGQVGNSEFKMSVVHKPEELLESLTSLDDAIKEVPLVEEISAPEDIDTSDYSTSVQRVKLYDYMGNIDRQIRNIRYLLNDNDTVAFSLPVVMPESKTADFIKEYAAADTGGKPVVQVFNVDNFKEKLDSFYSMNEMRKSFEKSTNENQIAYFRKLIGRLAESVHILSKTKLNSSNKMVDYANMIFSTALKASFNQYSPSLEAEEIERIRSASFNYETSVEGYTPFSLKSSSRVKYDLFSTAWIAEDQSRTSIPFGIHQVQEEVLAPVIQNLMAANRIERLKIYNHIKDLKDNLLKEWQDKVDDFKGRNRAEANTLINLMTEAYTDYIRSFSTYKALHKTQTDMQKNRSLEATEVQQSDNEAEVIAGFEIQAKQFENKKEEFSDYVTRLEEDIKERAAQFGYIPYYEATLRDKEYRDIAQSTDKLQNLDPRRKRLLSISPYIAKYAKLPPPPNLEQKMYDDFAIDLLKEAANAETIWEEKAPVEAEETEDSFDSFEDALEKTEGPVVNDEAREEKPDIPTVDEAQGEEEPDIPPVNESQGEE